MKKLDYIKSEWERGFEYLRGSEFFKTISTNQISLREYSNVLIQNLYQAKEHHSALVKFASKLKGNEKLFIKDILRHSIHEANNGLLALKDIKTLGFYNEKIVSGEPLEATKKMTDYLHKLVDDANPLPILGYFFHFEVTPSIAGLTIFESLKKCGIPEAALKYVQDWVRPSGIRNSYVEKYLESHIVRPEDLKSAGDAAKSAAMLHAKALSESLNDSPSSALPEW